jgi:hypothetical protein
VADAGDAAAASADEEAGMVRQCSSGGRCRCRYKRSSAGADIGGHGAGERTARRRAC